MKKLFALLTVLTLVLSGFIAPVHAQDIDSDKVYISETSLFRFFASYKFSYHYNIINVLFFL